MKYRSERTVPERNRSESAVRKEPFGKEPCGQEPCGTKPCGTNRATKYRTTTLLETEDSAPCRPFFFAQLFPDGLSRTALFARFFPYGDLFPPQLGAGVRRVAWLRPSSLARSLGLVGDYGKGFNDRRGEELGRVVEIALHGSAEMPAFGDARDLFELGEPFARDLVHTDADSFLGRHGPLYAGLIGQRAGRLAMAGRGDVSIAAISERRDSVQCEKPKLKEGDIGVGGGPTPRTGTILLERGFFRVVSR